MEQQLIGTYVHLGASHRYLEDSQQGWEVHGPSHVLSNLTGYLRMLDQLGLPVTKKGTSYVGLAGIKTELEKLPEKAALDSAQALKLREAMKELRITLYSESSGKEAFVVTDKRYEVKKLLHAPAELLPPGLFEALDELTRYDIEEAGRCVAFERPTAAAFHLMRATEATLRRLYCAKVKRGRKKPLLWGSMVDHLRQRSDSPPRPLLDGLDNIRHNFRNPTQHPDAIYDIQEAQDLLALALDAIGRAASAMP
jgi:hypothetical protein